MIADHDHSYFVEFLEDADNPPISTAAMSFFGAKSAAQTVNPQAVAQAEGELEMIMDLFQKLGNACHSKCINKSYHESELSKGESVCIDRCVSKYFGTNAKIGEKLQKQMEAGQSMGMGL